MKPLGKLLLERGWITEPQLDAALIRKEQQGARLGTTLLEMGAISEELLLSALADQLAVPAADIEDLRHLDPAVTRLLPAEIAIRAEAIPFRVVGSRVDIALLDVRNLTLQDELSFVIGKRIRVHIGNEARIFEALEAYYGKECSFRFRHLLERLNRSRDRLRAGPAGPPQPVVDPPPAAPPLASPVDVATGGPPAAASVPEPSSLPWEETPEEAPPPRRRSIPLTRAERRALQGAERPKQLSDEGPEWKELLKGFQRRLDEAESSVELGELLLDALSEQFVRVLLFRVAHEQVTGWVGRGPGLRGDRLRDYSIPLSEPSPFRRVARDLQPVRGVLEASPASREFLALWDGSPDLEGLWWPLAIRDRLVCVAYGDRDQLGVDGVDLGLVQQLSAHAGVALERRVVERKLKQARGLH